jgi:hypothetical protein
MPTTYRFFSILCCIAAWLTLLIQSTPINAQSISNQTSANAPSASSPFAFTPAGMENYPPDLPNDIEWSAYRFSWDEMVVAFNQARIEENRLLNRSMAPFVFPAAASWEAMSSGERALWLINEERVARGLRPLHALEENVSGVAQAYAEFLLASNQFDHDADGHSPWDRLAANAAIGACSDFLGIAENIYFQATTGSDPLPYSIEKAIYIMIYSDAGSQWGHRHAILWTPYTENNGAPDREGFLGIGLARGAYTSPFDGKVYQSTDMVVMNFFDPCATWQGETAATSTPSPSPSPSPTPSAIVSPSPTPNPTTTAMPSASPTASPAPTTTPTPAPSETPTPTGPSGTDLSFALHLPLISPQH